MRIIDARTGAEATIGVALPQGRGEWIRVEEVKGGLFSAKARVTYRYFDWAKKIYVIEIDRWVPLTVRWTHPNFLFRQVAFLNT